MRSGPAAVPIQLINQSSEASEASSVEDEADSREVNDVI
jgi:hypothetical protein